MFHGRSDDLMPRKATFYSALTAKNIPAQPSLGLVDKLTVAPDRGSEVFVVE